MSTRRFAASLALAGLAITALAACAPPEQTGLTPQQCARFLDARHTLDAYISDDWAAFHGGEGISVLSGLQRAVGEFEDAATELETPETTEALAAVVDAGHAIVLLAGDYLDEPPVLGDPADLAEQAEVRDALDAALSSCTE